MPRCFQLLHALEGGSGDVAVERSAQAAVGGDGDEEDRTPRTLSSLKGISPCEGESSLLG